MPGAGQRYVHRAVLERQQHVGDGDEAAPEIEGEHGAIEKAQRVGGRGG